MEELRELGRWMQYFRAPIFVCSAPAERWALGQFFDEYVEQAQAVMKEFSNIIVHTGASFWASIRRFSNPSFPMHHYDVGIHAVWRISGTVNCCGPWRAHS